MELQFPPAFYLLLGAGVLSAALVVISWRRRSVNGAAAIAVLMAGSAFWCFTYGLQQIFLDDFWKPLIDLITYGGILLVPAAWLIFSFQYTGRAHWVNRRAIALLCLEPLLVIIALATDPLHHLFYVSKSLVWINGYAYLLLGHGPLFWVNAIYSYLLLLVGSILLVRSMLHAPALYRSQTIALLVAVAAPWVANLIYNLGLSPVPGLDLTPLAFTVSGLAIVLGVLRYRLLDLTPLARDALIEGMDDSVIVLDKANRIIDINPSACRLFERDPRQLIGAPARDLFSNWLDLASRFATTAQAQEAITLQIAGHKRTYDLRIFPLNNFSKELIGRLILLRDTTDAQEIQDALVASETRYRSVVNTSPDAIILTSLKGNLLLYNQAAANMYAIPEGEDPTGVLVYDFIIPTDRPRTRAYSKTALETGQMQYFECTCQTRLGKTFPGEISLTALLDVEGKPNGFVCVLRDASERKRNEQEMQRIAEAERAQREVADALREIGVVLSSTLDQETILDQLLEQVGKVIPYDSGNVTLISGNKAWIARSRGYERFGSQTSREISTVVFEVEKTENFRWMMEHKQPLIISDTHQYPGWITLDTTAYIRSYIGAPIIAQDQVIAFFSLDNAEPNFYQEDHGRILAAFAAQAALAMQNADLFRETRELLTREQRLNDILQKIGSTLDLNQVLNDILSYGCDLFSADLGLIGLLNADRSAVEVNHIFHSEAAKFEQVLPKGTGITWEVIETGQPILLHDYFAHPKARLYLHEFGVCSMLMAPVRTGEEILGILAFYMTTTEKRFHDRDIPLAVTIGREAGIAIQNARLFSDARKRAEEAETLRQASSAITSALKLDQVLEQIISNLARVVPYDSCAIFLLEEDSLRVVAARGFSDPTRVIGQVLQINNPLTQEGFRTRRVIILPDAQQDARFQAWGDAMHVHGWMGIPLFARGVVTGFLTIDSREPNAYTDSDGVLAQAFANQAAVAIENARLFEKVQHLAITDPLTELFNRRHFFELGRREFYRARRYGKPMALIMIDVDDLKLVNDTYGHLAGDQLIEMVGAQCRRLLRQADLAARYAGDEFIILLPETDLESAVNAALRIQESTDAGIAPDDQDHIPASISMGVSSLDASCFSLEILINRADQALYAAKQSGKHRVCIWKEGQFEILAGDRPDRD